jgi:DNA-directed RNA polymerase specialized sigma24 family protein
MTARPEPGNSEKRRGYRALTESALMVAMRRLEAGAIDEFILRYHAGLVERVRRAGFWNGQEADEHVLEVLADTAIGIAGGNLKPRSPVFTYLFAILRNRHSALHRERAKIGYDKASLNAGEKEGNGELAAYALLSAYSLRGGDEAGVDEAGVDDAGRLPPGLRRLASLIDEGLTDEERDILAWRSHHVSQRQIAEWLDVTYAAGTQRISRLRARLRKRAMEYAATLDAAERRELRAWFQRAEPAYCEALSAGLDDKPARQARVAESSATFNSGKKAGES